MVIRQTASVHDEIADMLEQLRTLRGRYVRGLIEKALTEVKQDP